MPKPGDVYVGVIDLFSILMPGALLTFALVSIDSVRDYPPLAAAVGYGGDAASWVAFAVSSYVLGHLLFLLSGKLDGPYDSYRKRRWPPGSDHCFAEASKLRCRYFANGQPAVDDNPMNTFKWAKAFLLLAALAAPAALAEVNRYEADSKFFRSMVAAFPLIAIIFAVQAHGEAAVVALAMTVIGFVCYAERRYKSTEWAYRYVITLDRLSARGADAAQIEGARIRRHFRPK